MARTTRKGSVCGDLVVSSDGEFAADDEFVVSLKSAKHHRCRALRARPPSIMRAHDGRQAREASRCLPRKGPQAFRWCAAMHMAAFDRSATTELIKLGATTSEYLLLQWTRAL